MKLRCRPKPPLASQRSGQSAGPRRQL